MALFFALEKCFFVVGCVCSYQLSVEGVRYIDIAGKTFPVDMLARRAATGVDSLNCAFATLYVALP